jgi:hypothetical protein
MQGRIKADTAMEAKDTPLQLQLETMAKQIGYFGFLFAFLTFIAMIVAWFAGGLLSFLLCRRCRTVGL